MTFFNVPSGVDGGAVVFGVSSGVGSNTNFGSALAPNVIRKVSKHFTSVVLTPEMLQIGSDVASHFSDAGDTRWNQDISPRDFYHLVELRALSFAAKSKPFIAVGGDHAITPALIRGVAKTYGRLQVVHIDAHSDYQGSYSRDKLHNHSNHLNETELLPEVVRICCVGVRAMMRSVAEASEKIIVVPRGGMSFLEDRLDPNLPTYISLDVDVLDPSFLGAVAFPVHFGISPTELSILLQLLFAACHHIVGFDLVEYAVSLDSSRQTSARLVTAVLGGVMETMTSRAMR